MPWHTGGAKPDPLDQDGEDTVTNQEKPISKKINYAALEAIVGGDKSSPATPSASSSLPSPPPAADQPNRLLEATIRDSSVAANLFPASLSSPALLGKTSAEEEVEEEFEVEEQEESEDEEEEVVDWNEGEDLW